jgi:hypothetical protein
MTDDLVKQLRNSKGWPTLGNAAADRIEELEAENEKLRKGLDIYERERNRFRHAKPEITGAYFLSGGHGEKDDNLLPQFVRIVPAYGCAWEQVYEKTDKTISYEGS